MKAEEKRKRKRSVVIVRKVDRIKINQEIPLSLSARKKIKDGD